MNQKVYIKKKIEMREMGSKAPKRLKSRRPTCRCDLCGCSFLSIQALRTHQACLHPKTKRVAYKPNTEVIARRTIQTVETKSKTLSLKSGKLAKEIEEKLPGVNFANKRKSGFECPVCSKLFAVYFSAHRHIQKNHCVNDKGEAVAPNSSSLIKPLCMEHCINCNVRDDVDSHKCTEILTINNESTRPKQICLGCDQEFKSMHMFEMHLSKVHGDDVENLFFPDMNKFLMWKNMMEVQTDRTYLATGQKDNSQVFHCNHFQSNETTTMFCPSSISKQVLSKGVYITFYKKHFGHAVKQYTLPDIFSKCLVTSLMRNSECYTETKVNNNDNDMYLELKRLMENIVIEAAKVNVTGLKLLLSKALEMSTVLNNHKNDEDQKNLQTSKSMTDDEISQVLVEAQNKRKVDQSNTNNVKKVKIDTVAKIEPRVILKPETQKSQVETEVESNVKVAANEKSSYVNTIPPSQPLKGDEDVKDLPKPKSIQSPKSFSDSYMNFVDENFGMSAEKPKTRKKEIVKTRIGQFKPNLSLKSKEDDIRESLPRIQYSYSLPKDEIKYEVLEREHDCNILIIKI